MSLPPPTWTALLRGAALRAALAGAALALVGAPLQVFMTTGGRGPPGALLAEVLFDLSIGLFVVLPTALVERWAGARWGERPQVLLAAPLVGVVAWAGATAAFLQTQYGLAVLRTGSLRAGVEALVSGGQWIGLYADLVGLFLSIGAMFAALTAVRQRGLDVLAQGGVAFGLALPTALLLLVVTGASETQVAISAAMISAGALGLPAVYRGADVLEARWFAAEQANA